MRNITLLVSSVLPIAAQACATPPSAARTQLTEASTPSVEAAPAQTASTADVVRARKVEIVDGKGRPRITMGADDEHGVTSLQFLGADGDMTWTAMQYDEAGGANGDGKPGPAFVMQGEVGDSICTLWIAGRGCALQMGAENDEDEGGIGLGYTDGKSFVTLSASKPDEGDPENASISLQLVGKRIVVTDINSKEIASFPAPVADPKTPQPKRGARVELTPIAPPSK